MLKSLNRILFKKQTVIEGILSVFSLNLLARASAYLKVILIAAYIGLTSGLDSFYMATAILGMVVFTFGDVFDSLGIPNLVKTMERGGDDAFKRLTGSIFTLAVIMGISLTILLIVTQSLTVNIAHGFSVEAKADIKKMLFILTPVALLYLPYHAIGSFFRSIRNYQLFYIADVILSFSSLIFIIFYHENAYAVAISLSFGYSMGFFYLFMASKGRFLRYGSIFHEEMKGIMKSLFPLLSLYGVFHLYVIVDRYFASFLSSGSVSGLSYGIGAAYIVVGLFRFESIFITPLSESEGRSEKLQRAIIGVIFISIPLLIFMSLYSREIIRMLFERGLFDKRATMVTSDALSFYVIGLPAFFLWPIFYRLFQILESMKTIGIIALIGVITNALLNYILVLNLGFGVKGIAAATVATYYFLSLSSLYLFKRYGIKINFSVIIKYIPLALAGSLCSYWATTFISPLSDIWLDVIIKGALYMLIVGIYYLILPIREEYNFARGLVKKIF